MAWYDDLGSSIYNMGAGAGNWAMNNPIPALSLGVGAAGTAAGIYDQSQAQRAAERREHLAEQMMRMGPGAYAPNYSPEQLQAMYFRPASSFMQQQGVNSGGAFQQGLADSALKAEGDRQALGNQIYQARLAALGYGPPPGPSGTTGALGQSLQSLMLMQALAGRNQNQQPQVPGAVAPWSTVGGVDQWGMRGQGGGGGGGGGSFYPPGAMGNQPNYTYGPQGYGVWGMPQQQMNEMAGHVNPYTGPDY